MDNIVVPSAPTHAKNVKYLTGSVMVTNYEEGKSKDLQMDRHQDIDSVDREKL